MKSVPSFGPEKENAYQDDRAQRLVPLQRWLVLTGGGLYCLTALWLTFRAGSTTGALGSYSLMLLVFTVLLFGLSFVPFVQKRLELIPILMALSYGAHISVGVIDMPVTGAIRFGVLFGLLSVFLAAISPTLQVALASIAAAVIISALALVVLYPMQRLAVDPALAYGYYSPFVVLAVAVAIIADRVAREAFAFKWELERRATTDELSGVSNRAHIAVLVDNEFSRARRYREPLSCLMLEIDDLDGLRARHGDHAADTVIRVFAGYCVLVMRHCDSFGRIAAHRFVALLPETPGVGALTLAERMVRDLANLDVQAYGQTINFTVSVGVAEMALSDRFGADLVLRAQRALDDAIEQGRNQAAVAAPRGARKPAAEEAEKAEA